MRKIKIKIVVNRINLKMDSEGHSEGQEQPDSNRGWCIKFATGLNGRFTTISSHFVANYIDIFHKTVVQTVILRCWTGLYLIWFKSYATNTKNEKNQRKCKKHEKHYTNECFFTKSQKSRNINICVLCHNFWPNYNLDLLSTSKWPSEPQFCERYVCRWQKFG